VASPSKTGDGLSFAGGRIKDAAVMHSDSHQNDPQHRAGTGAFFGRRKGKALRAGQTRLVDTLLPRLALDLERPAPANLADLFPLPVRETRLEIGFGGGEHLIAQAQANPDCGFIGVEPFLNGMAKALAAIEALGLGNVRLHRGDATDLLAWLPQASLARIDLLYPDPWPKRRHWKRRFVQDRSVAALARVLRPGGEFRFASDIDDYTAWTLMRLLRAPQFLWTAERAHDWREPWPDFRRTRYEAKAIREGRKPCYLSFRRI
jgi:tRNA (guanine-N7-)-methyltransferase